MMSVETVDMTNSLPNWQSSDLGVLDIWSLGVVTNSYPDHCADLEAFARGADALCRQIWPNEDAALVKVDQQDGVIVFRVRLPSVAQTFDAAEAKAAWDNPALGQTPALLDYPKLPPFIKADPLG